MLKGSHGRRQKCFREVQITAVMQKRVIRLEHLSKS